MKYAFEVHFVTIRASQVALVVKNPPAIAWDIRDAGTLSGSGRSTGEGHGNLFHILAWRIPRTEEPGGLWSSEVCCCCSVAQSCSTICDPIDCITPGFPALHQLVELAQLMSTESVMPSNHLVLRDGSAQIADSSTHSACSVQSTITETLNCSPWEHSAGVTVALGNTWPFFMCGRHCQASKTSVAHPAETTNGFRNLEQWAAMRLKRTANFKEETATPEYRREKVGHFRQRSFGKSKMSFKEITLQRAEGTNQPVVRKTVQMEG